ncbi:MAG: YmdB family metallophosphoesterase [Candidatus Kerfeldbacteria bacterium]|nr:YmdB family metallophosphoesterase [Candidatus Kerfeldbacteria bacterium]
MNILLFGDVVGKPGRIALKKAVPELRKKHGVDFVIANVENLAHGFGITPDTIQELRDAEVDFFTSGNHVWKNEKGAQLLQANPRNILRPANYPADRPGRGWSSVIVGGTALCIINLMGQVFMPDEKNITSPFTAFDELYAAHGKDAITIVDLHAEATGEKRAFGWYVDGRASVVVGTHTHVQTADEQILTQGTAYISDLGMTGATDSSLGMNKELVIKKVAQGLDISLEPPENPREVVASGVLVSINTTTKRAENICRIDQKVVL